MQAGTQRSGGLLKDDWLRRDGERLVLSGFVPLYTRTSQRVLVMSIGERKVAFRIGLAATPQVSDEFGPWQHVDLLNEEKTRRAADVYEIRYRVPEWRP
jgi:hypothetical protein